MVRERDGFERIGVHHGSAGEHQRRIRFGQHLRGLARAALLESAHGQQRAHVGRGERAAPASRLRAAPASTSRRPDGGEELRFGSGPQRQPAVGRGGSDGEARFGVQELAAHARPPLPELPELAGIPDRREPAAEEIRADAQHGVGVGQVVNRQALPAEHGFRRLPFHRAAHQRADGRRGRAERLRETLRARASGCPRPVRRGWRCAPRCGFGESLRRRGDGFVPGNGRELRLAALAGALHGAAQAGGMVEPLHRRLAARAQPAAADGVERIAFHLFNSGDALVPGFAIALDGAHALHDADDGAASGGAFGANRRPPFLLAGDEFVLLDEHGNEGIALVPAARRQRARRSGRKDLEKSAPVHLPRPPNAGCVQDGASMPAGMPAWPAESRRYGRQPDP